MRVLFWSETFWPRIGGVENIAARLLTALQARGYEFAVVTWEHADVPDVIHYQGIPVYRFPFFSGTRQGSLDPVIEHRRQVTKLKQDFAPDVVHINSYGRSVFFLLDTPCAHPALTLLTLHQALPDEPIGRNSLLGHLLRRAAWVTACSASVLAHARRLLPEIAPISSVIRNGIETLALAPQPLTFDPPRILCLGRLVPEKGFDLALRAFEIVLHRFPTAHLIVAGDGRDRDKLKQQARDLGIAHGVEFAGSVPPETVPQLISETTVVLIPSRLEGFGLVALDAAVMARPVVATRVGGLPEIILHEETGLLTEMENGEGLAEAVRLLLEHPENARRMGLAARERVQKEFGWERHVDAYDALYRKLLIDARQGPSMDSRGANRVSP